MANQNSKHGRPCYPAFPLILLAATFSISDKAIAQSFSDEIHFVERTVLTRIEGDAPIRGYRISPEDIGPNGHNFEYCNKGTAKVDLSKFKSIGEECEKPGWAYNLEDTKKNLIGASVYARNVDTDEYMNIGKVVPKNHDADDLVTVDFYSRKPEKTLQDISVDSKGIDIVRSQTGSFSIILDDELFKKLQPDNM